MDLDWSIGRHGANEMGFHLGRFVLAIVEAMSIINIIINRLLTGTITATSFQGRQDQLT